jgi:putative ABC transport system permease protein
MQIIYLLIGLCEKGILFSFLIMGIYISSRIIRFDNMSIEGGFSIGGALAAVTLGLGWHPLVSVIAGACVGGLTGVLTGILYEKLHINKIMSGIIVTTGLFSVVLKMASSNICLPPDAPTLFSFFRSACGYDLSLIFLVLFVTGIIFLMQLFFKTKLGLFLYGVGCNRQFIITLRRSPAFYMYIGLFLSNFFAGLSHALFVHYLGYFSIWFSSGILVTALGGMILGSLVSLRFGYGLVLGGILYQAILVCAINVNIHPDWNRLITAVFIIVVLLGKKNSNFLSGERL